MFDKDYFLNQLRNGEDMETVAKNIADAINEAQDAYANELAAKEKEAEAAALTQNKREMALDLIDIIRDYGRMVAPETADILDNFDDEDVDMMVRTLDEMFNMMTTMARLKTSLENIQPKNRITPTIKPAKSDDEVLANFITSLM